MILRLPRWLALLLVFLLGYFDPEKWAVWDYRATILNDGVNSGNHAYVFTAGAGNICILVGGKVLNGDPASRAGNVRLRNGDDDRIRDVLRNQTIAGDKERDFPTSELAGDDNSASVPPEVIISGVEDLIVNVSSIAVSEDSAVSLQMLVSGGPPTVVLTSPTGATETETENRIV